MSDQTAKVNTDTDAATEAHPRMSHGGILDIKLYTGPTKVCPECDLAADDEETVLIMLEVSGTNNHNTQFVLCIGCLSASLEEVSEGRNDSISVSTP